MAQYERILKKSASRKLLKRGDPISASFAVPSNSTNRAVALSTEELKRAEQLNRKMDSMRNLQCQMLEKRIFKKRVVESSSSSEEEEEALHSGRNALVGIHHGQHSQKHKPFSPFFAAKLHSSFILKH